MFGRIPPLILEKNHQVFFRNIGNPLPSDTFWYSKRTYLSNFSFPSDFSSQRVENGFVLNFVMDVKVKLWKEMPVYFLKTAHGSYHVLKWGLTRRGSGPPAKVDRLKVFTPDLYSCAYVCVCVFVCVCVNVYIFIHSLVFSLRGRVGRNQSPAMWSVWLWHTASWASSWR